MNLLTKVAYLFFVLNLCFCASEKESRNKKLSWFLEEKGFDKSNLESILVLTEEGCPACNRSFANLVEKHLSNPKTLCIVSAKGNRVDLSPFLNVENVVLDMQEEFNSLAIAKGSSAILLQNNGDIDTIVEIKARGIQETLVFLNSALQEGK